MAERSVAVYAEAWTVIIVENDDERMVGNWQRAQGRDRYSGQDWDLTENQRLSGLTREPIFIWALLLTQDCGLPRLAMSDETMP
jgi:hypothetical protein